MGIAITGTVGRSSEDPNLATEATLSRDPHSGMRVPPDWSLVPLGALCSFANGVNANKSAYGQGTPFINVLEVITHTHLRVNDIPGRVRLSKAALESFAVRRGDVLFNRTSETPEEVGLSTVYEDDTAVVFGGFVIRGRFLGDSLDPGFVRYGFRAPIVRRQIVAQGQGAVRANISQANLRRVLVPVPPLSEQRAIAKALSNVDKLHEALEALIAKKRAIKQATVQQLLTGKTRLPGFSGAWEARPVEMMGEVLAGKALAVNGPGSSRPYLRTKNVLDGQIDLSDVLRMPMTDTEFERFRLRHNDVLLNEGQSLELVGRCSIYQGEFGAPCAIQNQLVRFRALPSVSAGFCAQLFRFCQHTGIFARIALQTTSVAHLGVRRFQRLMLAWPTQVEEQSAIATVLSDMDDEIDALERRRDKTGTIKHGMMQQLLTGRVRLVEPVSARESEARA